MGNESLTADGLPRLVGHEKYVTDVVLVRHGETDFNVEGRLQGWRPVPLNEKGRQQVVAAGQALVGLDPGRVLTSPVLRAVETAQIVCDQLSLDHDCIEHDDRFGEFRMGEFTGQRWLELSKDPRWAEYLRAPHEMIFPGGEALVEIYRRSVEGLNHAVTTGEGGRMVITSHGGIVRLLLMAALELPLSSYHKIRVPNASISRIRIRSDHRSEVHQIAWQPRAVPPHWGWV